MPISLPLQSFIRTLRILMLRALGHDVFTTLCAAIPQDLRGLPETDELIRVLQTLNEHGWLKEGVSVLGDNPKVLDDPFPLQKIQVGILERVCPKHLQTVWQQHAAQFLNQATPEQFTYLFNFFNESTNFILHKDNKQSKENFKKLLTHTPSPEGYHRLQQFLNMPDTTQHSKDHAIIQQAFDNLTQQTPSHEHCMALNWYFNNAKVKSQAHYSAIVNSTHPLEMANVILTFENSLHPKETRWTLTTPAAITRLHKLIKHQDTLFEASTFEMNIEIIDADQEVPHKEDTIFLFKDTDPLQYGVWDAIGEQRITTNLNLKGKFQTEQELQESILQTLIAHGEHPCHLGVENKLFRIPASGKKETLKQLIALCRDKKLQKNPIEQKQALINTWLSDPAIFLKAAADPQTSVLTLPAAYKVIDAINTTKKIPENLYAALLSLAINSPHNPQALMNLQRLCRHPMVKQYFSIHTSPDLAEAQKEISLLQCLNQISHPETLRILWQLPRILDDSRQSQQHNAALDTFFKQTLGPTLPNTPQEHQDFSPTPEQYDTYKIMMMHLLSSHTEEAAKLLWKTLSSPSIRKNINDTHALVPLIHEGIKNNNVAGLGMLAHNSEWRQTVIEMVCQHAPEKTEFAHYTVPAAFHAIDNIDRPPSPPRKKLTQLAATLIANSNQPRTLEALQRLCDNPVTKNAYSFNTSALNQTETELYHRAHSIHRTHPNALQALLQLPSFLTYACEHPEYDALTTPFIIEKINTLMVRDFQATHLTRHESELCIIITHYLIRTSPTDTTILQRLLQHTNGDFLDLGTLQFLFRAVDLHAPNSNINRLLSQVYSTRHSLLEGYWDLTATPVTRQALNTIANDRESSMHAETAETKAHLEKAT